MGLRARLQSAFAGGATERALTIPPDLPTVDMFRPWFTFNGVPYPIGAFQSLQGSHEDPPANYTGIVTGLYQTNPVVFACIDNRVKLFSEARFQYRQFRAGHPGNLFGTADLALLENPWPGGTTGDLLAKMLQAADLEGDAFVVHLGDRLAVPRPDWMAIIVEGDVRDLGAPVAGYVYLPDGRGPGVALGVDQVAHFAPIPDPLRPHRGMSWLMPIVREVLADSAMTSHKSSFLANGATVNLVVEITPGQGQQFRDLVAQFREGHEGAGNAYKTLFTTPSMKVTPVGQDMQQVDFKVVQGAGETRIAAAAGVPPVIVGLSEGLAAATYSNYGQARRRFADQTMRPLWRNAAGSLANIINVPPGAELWYDDRDISALKEDLKDLAQIQQVNSEAIVRLSAGGFLRSSAVQAVTSNDLSLLVEDPNWVSVQVQPSGAAPTPPSPVIGGQPNG